MMQPNDSTFWQYKLYADIRGGSQHLCKFSLDFIPAPIYYTCNCNTFRSRLQVQVFRLWQLATNTASAEFRGFCEVRD